MGYFIDGEPLELPPIVGAEADPICDTFLPELRRWNRAAHERYKATGWTAYEQCESPLEVSLFDALVYYQLQIVDVLMASYIRPQYQIDRFRADFLVVLVRPDGAYIKVVVEVDGHEFHERTKAQAARDKRRDRTLQALGYRVLRFTGSEVFADAFACAREVFDVALWGNP